MAPQLTYRALLVPTAIFDAAGNAMPNTVVEVRDPATGAAVSVAGDRRTDYSPLDPADVKTDFQGNFARYYVDVPGEYELHVGDRFVGTVAVRDDADIANPSAIGGVSFLFGTDPAAPIPPSYMTIIPGYYSTPDGQASGYGAAVQPQPAYLSGAGDLAVTRPGLYYVGLYVQCHADESVTDPTDIVRVGLQTRSGSPGDGLTPLVSARNIDHLDNLELQSSAVTFLQPEDLLYVAVRNTSTFHFPVVVVTLARLA